MLIEDLVKFQNISGVSQQNKFAVFSYTTDVNAKKNTKQLHIAYSLSSKFQKPQRSQIDLKRCYFHPSQAKIFTVAAQIKAKRRSEMDGRAVIHVHLPQQEFFTELRSKQRANGHSHSLSGLCSQWKVNDTSHLHYLKKLQRPKCKVTSDRVI